MIEPKDYVIDKLGWDERDCHVIPIKTHSLFFDHFCYLDTKDYMADQLFENAGLKVRFGKEYASPETDYVFVFCKCLKRDRTKFLETIRKLPPKALLLGHKDYLDVCRRVIRTLPVPEDSGMDNAAELPADNATTIERLDMKRDLLAGLIDKFAYDYTFMVIQGRDPEEAKRILTEQVEGITLAYADDVLEIIKHQDRPVTDPGTDDSQKDSSE